MFVTWQLLNWVSEQMTSHAVSADNTGKLLLHNVDKSSQSAVQYPGAEMLLHRNIPTITSSLLNKHCRPFFFTLTALSEVSVCIRSLKTIWWEVGVQNIQPHLDLTCNSESLRVALCFHPHPQALLRYLPVILHVIALVTLYILLQIKTWRKMCFVTI